MTPSNVQLLLLVAGFALLGAGSSAPAPSAASQQYTGLLALVNSLDLTSEEWQEIVDAANAVRLAHT